MTPRDHEAAVRELVEARWPALVRFGVLLTGDVGHAEDLVQSALEKCWRRWPHVDVDSPERYVKAAMANLSASRWRKRRVREVALDDAADGPTRDGAQEQVLLRDELWRELHQLPPRMRAVVVLRWVEDLSEAQTAAALGCSVGSVKSQSSRALGRLRGQLQGTTTHGERRSIAPRLAAAQGETKGVRR